MQETVPYVLLWSYTASTVMHVWLLPHELPIASGFPCNRMGTSYAYTYHRIVAVVAKVAVVGVLG